MLRKLLLIVGLSTLVMNQGMIQTAGGSPIKFDGIIKTWPSSMEEYKGFSEAEKTKIRFWLPNTQIEY